MIKLFRNIRKSLLMENKTSKYFKYAIGEIILVVIGILIALQINNWNENEKKHSSWITYTESLIKDLKQDTITLNMVTKFIKNDQLAIENLSKRLSSKYANKDTLVKISRFELAIESKAYRPPNNKTFLAMQANGSIELFDKKTYALLLELQNQQTIAGSIIKANNKIYISQLENLISKYSIIENNPLPNGPLANTSWKNVNTDDLFSTVRGYLTAKSLMNFNSSERYSGLLQFTEIVLERLIEIQKENIN